METYNILEKIFLDNDIDINQKILLGVSGGPDSMFLLSLLKNKNVFVAHVNYNKREDSKNDENIVRDFCLKNNIPFEILSLNNHKEHAKGNFQAIAREERYLFYKEIYEKYDCSLLLLAHHKDDFLETAIMQDNSKRLLSHCGIPIKNLIYNMKIFRPFLYWLWKDEILEKCKSINLKFALDYTNNLEIYTRNKIRNNLKKISLNDKEKLFQKYLNKEKQLIIKNKLVVSQYNNWKNSKFDCDKLIKNEYLENVIFLMIHEHFENAKLGSGKIKNIIDFLFSSNRTSVYKIDNKNKLFKKQNKLIF
ncbi:tRNA lysidine(34) synthetase TilS [Metamycoplasma buccale]|uniref:tRNA lysidine(34) synthetase TilS n=1 Tax=Metamycoplasma buccale TaxID=55602 RepID=UPI00398F7065